MRTVDYGYLLDGCTTNYIGLVQFVPNEKGIFQ